MFMISSSYLPSRCDSDSDCTMRWWRQTADPSDTVIGLGFYASRTHMDHRYVLTFRTLASGRFHRVIFLLLLPQVNVVCTKIKGEPIYEVIRPIGAHQELVAFYLPEQPEELFFVRMRNRLYRQTMDSILEGEWEKLPQKGAFKLIKIYLFQQTLPWISPCHSCPALCCRSHLPAAERMSTNLSPATPSQYPPTTWWTHRSPSSIINAPHQSHVPIAESVPSCPAKCAERPLTGLAYLSDTCGHIQVSHWLKITIASIAFTEVF